MSTDSQTDAVQLERPSPDVAVVHLNRTARRNAMDLASMERLGHELEDVLKDPALRVLILTGRGSAFCAGLDLGALLDAQQQLHMDAADAYALQLVYEGVVRRLRNNRVVVIAAVNGVAVGAGMGLALAADIRFASSNASFLVGAVKVGLSAGECGISYHLPRFVGASRAFELMLTGRAVGAEEALRIGLVADVVAPQDLMARSLACARQVLANSPYSTAHTKQLMWTNLDAPSLPAALELENHTQVLGLMTQDFTEAVQAFVEKRPPHFSGR